MSYPTHPLRTRADSLAAALAAATLTLAAALPSTAYDISLSVEPKSAVPDGDLSGLASVLNVPTGGIIADVDVTLDLPGREHGAWNGDLYILLSHGGVASVLVNRPGRTASNPFGYGDNGLSNITFDDTAASGDFHTYQETLGMTSSSSSPIGGTWQPDARRFDPTDAVTSHPRSAFLSVFDGLAADGDWILLVTDLSTGGQIALERWSLNITLEPDRRVPDSTQGILAMGGLTVAALALARRRGSPPTA